MIDLQTWKRTKLVISHVLVQQILCIFPFPRTPYTGLNIYHSEDLSSTLGCWKGVQVVSVTTSLIRNTPCKIYRYSILLWEKAFFTDFSLLQASHSEQYCCYTLPSHGFLYYNVYWSVSDLIYQFDSNNEWEMIDLQTKLVISYVLIQQILCIFPFPITPFSVWYYGMLERVRSCFCNNIFN